ncbi:TonB-dependent receptor domain-containing protein [Sphingobacterium bambusae]|uniref:TonB-dependent receptor domain-containing protein n=1 Tax=Sphingobacterium bambusae TaxID=662858 RepID=A0ABW6BH44_9SPHI|nr:TonB-dependent receptor [Sphingobacterium bambusae]WPL49718.1 TonB-dependent receptor [Sphingobacterium bambusae]
MKLMPYFKIIAISMLLLFSLGKVHAQASKVTVSGQVRDQASKTVLPYVNVVLKSAKAETIIAGTVTDEDGRFSFADMQPNSYRLQLSYTGYHGKMIPIYVGNLSEFLEIPSIDLSADAQQLEAVVVSGGIRTIDAAMDRKSYNLADNISQSGGSVLQAMQNLPGVNVQEGKVQLRGSDKVTILVDGKQTALTGFGSQAGLDNIPASSIERVEIINNPSAKYEANGQAGIINIIMKKERQEGWNGKVGLSAGLGALWERQENLPGIRPQYSRTPKVNPSLSLNYRKDKLNIFVQADNLYTETLNKNEFVQRDYDDGTVIRSQLKRNRNTNFLTTKAGVDWFFNDRNTLTLSGLYGNEKIIDRGDQPFFNADLSERIRLWQFLEDELKTTVMTTAAYQHKFKQAGHLLNMDFNYTFHREDEKYFYDNILPTFVGTDAFKLLSDEQVYDFNVDYSKPLRYGRFETGLKIRKRNIPTDMNFMPGENSVLDVAAGGWANYDEWIPAVFGNYNLENDRWEAELGLRLEYVNISYDVNPDHPTYTSSGYHYLQPFPTMRVGYKVNESNKISLFYNRRVDRPNEVDIRIFPKYDDAEIIKVGNPGLRPQFSNSVELGYKYTYGSAYLYGALYHRFSDATITRISTIVPGSPLVYAVFQNAGKSYNSGLEAIWNQPVSSVYTFTINGNIYRNQIDAFTVENRYPVPTVFTAVAQRIVSGNLKWNNIFRFAHDFNGQLSAVYFAPDIIPQGKMAARFSVDMGLKKAVQRGKGEIFLNATDLFNTMVIKREIQGNGFRYTSDDYYETQVVRLGYSYKF